MEASQASQASGSNAVGPSASATVDNKAVPGHSFLVTLRCPQPATIARKRKVAINPPPHGKQRVSCAWHLRSQIRYPFTSVRVPWWAAHCFGWQAFLPGLQGRVLSTNISVLKSHINGCSFPPSIGRIAGTYTSTAHFFTCSVLHYAIIHLFFVRCAKFHSAEQFLLYL